MSTAWHSTVCAPLCFASPPYQANLRGFFCFQVQKHHYVAFVYNRGRQEWLLLDDDQAVPVSDARGGMRQDGELPNTSAGRGKGRFCVLMSKLNQLGSGVFS